MALKYITSKKIFKTDAGELECGSVWVGPIILLV